MTFNDYFQNLGADIFGTKGDDIRFGIPVDNDPLQNKSGTGSSIKT